MAKPGRLPQTASDLRPLAQMRAGAPHTELVRVVVAADRAIAVQERVGLRLRPDRLHSFDERTGQRLSA